MQSLRNKVSLIGRLGQQPEITVFGTGNQCIRMSIAINEQYKDKSGEWIKNTQWYNIVAWNNRLIERISRQLGKGTEVMIEGKLVTRSYETKTGEKRFYSEVEMSNFLMLNPKPQVN